MKCQGTRIEEQRSSLPSNALHNHRPAAAASAADVAASAPGPAPADGSPTGGRLVAPTVPDEDFFSLIQRLQGGRLEDQRASLPQQK